MASFDPATFRLRLQRLLTTADLEPSGMPAAAILLVRRVDDPLPGRAADPDARAASPEWQRAARTALMRCYDGAAKPAAGPVSGGTNAVRFNDQSELLACLARDLLQGDVSACWWWQTWLRASRRITSGSIVEAWLRDPRHIPAALAALHRVRLAEAFARAMTARDARALFVAMSDAYELPALVRSTQMAVDAGAAEPTAERADSGREPWTADLPGEDALVEPTRTVAPAPWEDLLHGASISSTVGVEARTLLGVALAIWHAPLAVRTRAFQQAFHAWRCAAQGAPPSSTTRSQARVAAPRSVDTPPTAADERRLHVAESLRPRLEGDEEGVAPAEGVAPQNRPGLTAPVKTGPAGRFIAEGAASSDAVSPPPSSGLASVRAADPINPGTASPWIAAGERERGGPGSEGMPSPARVDAPIESAGADPEKAAASVPSHHRETAVVQTQRGGALFLVNALSERDGSVGWDRLAESTALPIGGWTWVALMARGLLGDRAGPDDPIWSALAALDGDDEHADEEAGGMFDRRATEVRPVLDVFLPAVRERLIRALSFGAGGQDEAGALLADRLLFRRSRLAWSATHVDLYMSMDQVDIAVRLAGLDANPGWVPALGRVVTFHFE